MPHVLKAIGSRCTAFCKKRFEKVREINRRYKNPRIKTTGLVSLALLMLRLYLFLLIALLFYKFITLIHS